MEYVYVIDDGLSLYFKHKQHVSILYILFISKNYSRRKLSESMACKFDDFCVVIRI